MVEAEYISKEAALACFSDWIDRYGHEHTADEMVEYQKIEELPAANVVQEENILKFYYVRSIDEYWIGRRIDNFYYARYESENQQWVWEYSRYLPWGEHVVSPTSLWKEHTYPSEPEEISFIDWLKGFSQKYVAADVRPVVRCRDCRHRDPEDRKCDSGEMERQGCVFPVDDDYFCAYGEM